MPLAPLSVQDHMRCLLLCFIPHAGNSHKEKAILWALVTAFLLLLVLRAVGLASFDDPLVAGFMTGGMEVLKLGLGYQVGSIHKGERMHQRALKNTPRREA